MQELRKSEVNPAVQLMFNVYKGLTDGFKRPYSNGRNSDLPSIRVEYKRVIFNTQDPNDGLRREEPTIIFDLLSYLLFLELTF